VYISGSAGVRSEGELPGCVAAPPTEDPNSALFRIKVIKVPLASPQDARIVSSPRIFEGLDAPARHADPVADQRFNRPGLCQWNTVTRQRDRFYVGGYGHGILLEWDPAKPWVDPEKGNPNSNPLYVVDTHPDINRPHELLSHPDGRTIVLAGTPGYGCEK